MPRNLDTSEDSIEELLSEGEVELSDISFQPNGREDVYRPSGLYEFFEKQIDRRLYNERDMGDFLDDLENLDISVEDVLYPEEE